MRKKKPKLNFQLLSSGCLWNEREEKAEQEGKSSGVLQHRVSSSLCVVGNIKNKNCGQIQGQKQKRKLFSNTKRKKERK